MDIEKTIKDMTIEDKVSFLTGKNFWETKDFAKYGIPSIRMSDGPHGLRYQDDKTDNLGVNESLPATCFPTAVTSASSWNRELYYEVGKAIGEEALSHGVSIVLGPGCNIKRNPLNGRNFEYLSEDPYLSGTMASSYIKGQQSTGVMSCVKHFAANNQEYKRFISNSIIDERTLNEIYLKAFMMAVKDAKPASIMCSYNKINGTYSSDNKWLLTNKLRNEWGFDGIVITDWGALNDHIEAIRAGLDLNMPGGSDYMYQSVLKAIKDKRLDIEDVDKCVRRILNTISMAKTSIEPVDYSKHHELAIKMAQEGAVLLKNEGN
ncbi:MAG: glycoside hydrolase family 3 N-terminal domain-containing protein, partial [Erysipelotrichaceae bacterium]